MNGFAFQIQLPNLLLLIVGLLFFLILIVTAVVSFREKEKSALLRSLILAFIIPLPYLIFGFYEDIIPDDLAWIIFGFTAFIAAGILLPVDFQKKTKYKKPSSRIDERDIMFSRKELEEESKHFNEYYSKYPEKKLLDDKFRTEPGLLKPGASFYDPFMFAAADATFNTVDALKSKVDGEVAEYKIEVTPQNISSFIKSWAKYLGAVTTGITELKDYHLYSNVGRGEKYGDEIELNHKFAIAFTVEMDFDMVKYSPDGPIVMESAKEYLLSGMIAVQIAEFIRRLGYPARAHIDGNYRVVCPLVAKDAGLGEIGRMGLLMTPKSGPRTRISVVTTDIPLIIESPVNDHTVIDFCNKCLKCADVCPSQAIPTDFKKNEDEIKRWQINQEACYTFWSKAGTDCGRCIAVCPYSHRDNFLHNFVRWGIRNSYLFRQLAVKLDNFFYGKKPVIRELDGWMKIS